MHPFEGGRGSKVPSFKVLPVGAIVTNGGVEPSSAVVFTDLWVLGWPNPKSPRSLLKKAKIPTSSEAEASRVGVGVGVGRAS